MLSIEKLLKIGSTTGDMSQMFWCIPPGHFAQTLITGLQCKARRHGRRCYLAKAKLPSALNPKLKAFWRYILKKWKILARDSVTGCWNAKKKLKIGTLGKEETGKNCVKVLQAHVCASAAQNVGTASGNHRSTKAFVKVFGSEKKCEQGWTHFEKS